MKIAFTQIVKKNVAELAFSEHDFYTKLWLF